MSVNGVLTGRTKEEEDERKDRLNVTSLTARSGSKSIAIPWSDDIRSNRIRLGGFHGACA